MSYSPFGDDFLDVYTKIITLTPFTVTGSGTHVPGTPHSYRAYVSASSKALFSSTGAVVFSTSVILAHPKAVDGTVLTSVSPDMDVVLPNGAKPRILQIGTLDDEQGVCAIELRT